MPGLPCNLFSTLQLLLSGAELTLVRAVFSINQTSILHQFQRQLAAFYSTFLVVDLTSGGPISITQDSTRTSDAPQLLIENYEDFGQRRDVVILGSKDPVAFQAESQIYL